MFTATFPFLYYDYILLYLATIQFWKQSNLNWWRYHKKHVVSSGQKAPVAALIGMISVA